MVKPPWTVRTILLVIVSIAASGWLVSLGNHSYSTWEITFDGKRTVLLTDDAFSEYSFDDWNGDGSSVDFGKCLGLAPIIEADPVTIRSRWEGSSEDFVFTRMPDTAESREKVQGQLPAPQPGNDEWHSSPSIPDSLMPALVKLLQQDPVDHDVAVRCYECQVSPYSLAYLLFIPGPQNSPGEFVVIYSHW